MEWNPPSFEVIKMDAEAKSYCDDFASREELEEPPVLADDDEG
jgi:hypothetical protein